MPAVDAEDPVWFSIAGGVPGIILHLSPFGICRVSAAIVKIVYLSLVLRTFRSGSGMGIDLNQIHTIITASGCLHLICSILGRVSHSHIHIGFRSPFTTTLVYKCRNAFVIELLNASPHSLLSGLCSNRDCCPVHI